MTEQKSGIQLSIKEKTDSDLNGKMDYLFRNWDNLQEYIFNYLGDLPTLSEDIKNNHKGLRERDFVAKSVIFAKHEKRNIAANVVIAKYREMRSTPFNYITWIIAHYDLLKILMPEFEKAANLKELKNVNQKEIELLIKLNAVMRMKENARKNGLRSLVSEIHEELENKLLPNEELWRIIIGLMEKANGIEIDYLLDQINNPESVLNNIKKKNAESKDEKNNEIYHYIEYLKNELEKKNIKDNKLVSALVKEDIGNIEIVRNEIGYLLEESEKMEAWNENTTLRNCIEDVKGLLLSIRDRFKDGKLYKELMLTNELRKIIFFVNEYKYLKGIETLTEKGYNESNWHDFTKVVDDINKEGSIISKEFGDRKLSEEIKNFAKQNKYNINAWLNYIKNILQNKFRSFPAISSKINEAKLKLLPILSGHVNELNTKLMKTDKLLKDTISGRIKELRNNELNYIREITKEIKNISNPLISIHRRILNHAVRQRKESYSSWKEISEEYDKMEIKTANAYVDILDFFAEFSNIYTPSLIEDVQNKNTETKEYVPRILSVLRKSIEDPVNSGRELSINYRLLRYIEREHTNVERRMFIANASTSSIIIENIDAVMEKLRLLAGNFENMKKYINLVRQEHFIRDEYVQQLLSNSFTPVKKVDDKKTIGEQSV